MRFNAEHSADEQFVQVLFVDEETRRVGGSELEEPVAGEHVDEREHGRRVVANREREVTRRLVVRITSVHVEVGLGHEIDIVKDHAVDAGSPGVAERRRVEIVVTLEVVVGGVVDAAFVKWIFRVGPSFFFFFKLFK